MARDLDAVLGLAGGRPAVLLGHSIGGMITADLRPPLPGGARVAGRRAGPGPHDLHRPGEDDQGGGSWKTTLQRPVLEPAAPPDDRALAAGLGDELAELPQRLVPPLDAQALVLPAPRPAASSTSPPASCRGPGPTSWRGGCSACSHYDATATLADDRRPDARRRRRPATRRPSPTPAPSWPSRSPAEPAAILAPGKHFGLIEQHPRFAEVVAAFAESTASHPAAVPEIV